MNDEGTANAHDQDNDVEVDSDNTSSVQQTLSQQPPPQPLSPPETLQEGDTDRVHFTHYREEMWWEGELPSPVALRAYNDLVPGAARRFLDDHFDRQQHNRAVESKDQEGSLLALQINSQVLKRGQIFGLIVAIVFGILGLLATLTGHDWVGGILGGGTVVGLATAFIVGRTTSPRAIDNAPDPSNPASPTLPTLPSGDANQT